MASHFEAKLHGFRRTQDGVVISYVVHPSDLSADMALAALGTRYMVAFEQLGDDDKPIGPVAKKLDRTGQSGNVGSPPTGAEPIKPRSSFNELKLSQQAGIRCGDAQFAIFLMDIYPATAAKYHDAANVVRDVCGVKSRAEFDTEQLAAINWRMVEAAYQQWLTDKRYKDSYR